MHCFCTIIYVRTHPRCKDLKSSLLSPHQHTANHGIELKPHCAWGMTAAHKVEAGSVVQQKSILSALIYIEPESVRLYGSHSTRTCSGISAVLDWAFSSYSYWEVAQNSIWKGHRAPPLPLQPLTGVISEKLQSMTLCCELVSEGS